MTILVNNISTHVAGIRNEIDDAIKRVLDRAWFVLGPEVEAFEKGFASHVGVDYCRSVANGTDALELGLRAVGVTGGDRVATIANAGMYTSSSLAAIRAVPVYMDVSLDTQLVTQEEVDRVIRDGAKAVVVTHLFGRAHPDIGEIAKKCRNAGVMLVEDCAQAHGASIGPKRVGAFGDIACFSFYPTKNLGALGDGGAVVTGNAEWAENVARLRQYGWREKYRVEVAGGRNSRLDEMQAAILSCLLPHLSEWNSARRAIAARYSAEISCKDVILPPTGSDDYVAHLYVIRSSRRNELKDFLSARGIMTDIHYPVPDHRQAVWEGKYANTVLPNTERLAREILTLPCYPELSFEETSTVIEAVNTFGRQ